MQTDNPNPHGRNQNGLKKLKEFYSKQVVDHCLHPRNLRRMRAPDGYFKRTETDGDSFEIFVRLNNGRVTECSFQTTGCAATLACGSMATELIKGKLYSDALIATSPDKIVEALGGLPEGNLHCADAVSYALKLALADSLDQKRSPWKKFYRHE